MFNKKMGVVSLTLALMLVFTFSFINISYADGHGEMKNIVDTAIEAEGFNTLVTAIQEAGLVDALKAEGPFTVFAPTDEAFEALPDGVLDDLLANPDELKNVLLFHVVEGKVMAEDVLEMDGAMVATLLGEEIEIKIDMGNVYINDAQVITTDIETSNGVIHVIDTVLVP
ncbi:MAG TPA: fasciclin domain-containing protein [Halanaerobiales bacterium]|nr:fasciclin domain-containing protein [Halanaerobiales bacterium]